jgi:DNA polymerase-3 subunit epsilon
MEHDKIEALAIQVANHPDYRVLRRLKPRTIFGNNSPKTIARAVVVDTETTGMDPISNEVIELALVVFEWDPVSGEAIRVVDTYDALEQPKEPIPAETTRIHGITDDMVVGKRIDDGRVASILTGVSLVIAHNAQFDRQFLERRLPIFESLPWACSLKDVPWSEEGLGSAKLDYLLNAMGYFHEAHRAEADCMALLEVLHSHLPVSGKTGLSYLLEGVKAGGCRIWARNSPFDNKDRLKALGYRWEASEKCWFLQTDLKSLDRDLETLKREGYNGKSAKVDVETQGALVKYSRRNGARSVHQL